MRSLPSLLQQLEACFRSASGWVLFRAGWRLRARKHFERVLQLRGDDFSAYVHLGRIAFAVGDYAGWRRELEHARRTSPARFARLRHPIELFEPRLAGTQYEDGSLGDPMFGGAGDRATWRSLLFGGGQPTPSPASGQPLPGQRAIGQRLERRTDDAPLPEAGGRSSSDAGLDSLMADGASARERSTPGATPRHGDDCASAFERRRFHELGPIDARELGQCDLDDLVRRLSG